MVSYSDEGPPDLVSLSFYSQIPSKEKTQSSLEISIPIRNIAVKGIKKKHLVEIRSMANPPAIVKVALESMCMLLEEKATDWKQIRAIVMKESFIPTIVNFNTEDIT